MTGKHVLCAFVCVAMTIVATPALSRNSEAPAATAAPVDATKKPSWMEYRDPYAPQSDDLSTPNRTTDEVERWAQQAITAVMNLSPDSYAADLGGVRRYFTPQGWNDLANFMRQANIINRLRNNNVAIATVISGEILIPATGIVDNAYQWQLRVPLLLSYTRPDPATGETVNLQSTNTMVVINIKRNADGLTIDRWTLAPTSRPAQQTR